MQENTTILIIDDNVDLAGGLQDILEDEGYQVELAHTAAAGLESFNQQPYHLVLLDIRLPDKSGAALVQELKQINNDVPVVMMTAYASVDTAIQSLQSGATAYLLKPLNTTELLVTVKRSLESYRLILRERELVEDLRLSEERHRIVSETLTDYAYVARVEPQEDGEISFRFEWLSGSGFKDICGVEPEEISTLQQMFSIVHPDDLSKAVNQVEGAVINSGSYKGEYRIIRPDGEMRWIQVNGELRKSRKDDTSILMYGAAKDITEQKTMEEQILASQKLASLGTMAAGIAHEINSPLQVITGISEILLKQVKTKDLDIEYLEKNVEPLHRNSWRVAEVIRSLVTYAQFSTEKASLQNLNRLVEDVLLLMSSRITYSSGIEIITNLEPDLPRLRCERGQLSQVLINLLTNARDAMPDGGTIKLQTNYDAEQQQVVLRISDTGQGIPEEIRDRIFDPFFTTRPVGHGSGLGLSIVIGVVRAHDGQIKVDSQPDRGTTFTLIFPVAVDNKEQ